MVHYTQQDYEELILNILQLKLTGLNLSTRAPLILTLKGTKISIDRTDFFKVMFCKKLCYKSPIPSMNIRIVSLSQFIYNKRASESKSLTNALIKFLRKVPLLRVPLYLQSFPELSVWRLKIGK
jgi:hypothetical protein